MKKILLLSIISLISFCSFFAQMNGTYYVEAGNPGSYQTIGEAVADLGVNGVDGAVYIILKEGVYNEQVTIPAISGVSAANSITFTTLAGETAKIQFTSTSTADNFVVKLDGAERILFENITIESLGASYANVIQTTNGSRYVTLSGLTLTAHPGSNSDVIDIIDVDAEYISISNCTINNGFNGIAIIGSDINKVEYITVSNNIFINSKKACLTAAKASNVVVSNNQFLIREVQTLFQQGLHFSNVYDYSVSQNYFSLTRNVGISLSYCAQSLTKAYVANNIISIRGDADNTNDVGIQIENGGRQEIYYNTIVLGNETNNAKGIYVKDAPGSGTNNAIVNNNIVNNSGGYVFHIEDMDVGIVGSLDYNNLYTTGTNIGNYRGTVATNLSSWRTTSGFDAHSISQWVQFIDTTYSIHCTQALDSAAIPVDITNDYFGSTRNNVPDIGATEFSKPILNFEEDTIKICEGESITIDAGEFSFASYTWSNGSNTSSITVSEEGTYKVQIGHPCWSPNDSVFVNVLDIPKNLDLPDTTEICSGNAAHIEVPVFEEASYVWTSGQTENYIDVSTEDLYKVTVANMCGEATDSTYLKVASCTNSLEDEFENNIAIYPIPLENQLTVETEPGTGATIKVLGIDGSIHKTLYTQESVCRIDCSDWRAGIYIITIQVQGNIYTRKVIKR